LESIAAPKTAAFDDRQNQYQEVKSRIHELLLNRLNLERLSKVRREDAEPELRTVIGTLLEKEAEATPLSLFERNNVVNDVLNELFGLGPLEQLLVDPDISDILVNRFDQVYIERNGMLEPVSAVFKDDRHLMPHHRRIVSWVGPPHRRVQAMVDARLPDGSRVNAIIPPLALGSPVLSIGGSARIGSAPRTWSRVPLTAPMLAF
jgi:pilus assembly protein CpaF